MLNFTNQICSIFLRIFIRAAFLLLLNSALATDYCRTGLCTKGKHIACNNPGKWGPNCGSNPKLHNMTECDKQFILDLHNEHRQEIASGGNKRYSKAQNMKEVTWNDELATVACYNAITCNFHHDNCRNTDDHPQAGQNLAIVGQSTGFKPFREAYKDLHTKWYMEHKECDMHHIRQYQSKPIPKNVQIGHFTQLVSDKVDQVGCCVSMYEAHPMKYVYIVCNYSYTNMLNKAIYAEGSPKCKKFSKRYDCLCTE